MGVNSFDASNGRDVGTRFQDVGEDEVVGSGTTAMEHFVEQEKGGFRVGPGRVGGDHCGVEIDVGGVEMIEDEASVAEIGDCEGAEADQLESDELGLAMAEGEEEGLDLLQMVEVLAFIKKRKYVLV